MSAINRIKQIIDYKSLSVRAFERLIGASNNSIQAAIKRNGSVKDDTLNKILQIVPEINPVWLLTGKGAMLKENQNETTIKEPETMYGVLTDHEKEIISNAFLLHPEEVVKIPVVKKWHEAALLDCENRLMREFIKLRQSE